MGRGGGGTSSEFEPLASVLAWQCSQNWAMKTHKLGAGPPFQQKNFYDTKLKQANNRRNALKLTLNQKQPTYL